MVKLIKLDRGKEPPVWINPEQVIRVSPGVPAGEDTQIHLADGGDPINVPGAVEDVIKMLEK